MLGWLHLGRYLSPRCMRSKALLISASGMVCVTNSSTFSCPARYSSTSLGTLSRLFQPGAGQGRGGEGRGREGWEVYHKSPITDGWCITSKSRSLPYTSSHQLEGPSGDFCRGGLDKHQTCTTASLPPSSHLVQLQLHQ